VGRTPAQILTGASDLGASFLEGFLNMEQLAQHLNFLPAWAVGPVVALLVIIVGYFISKIAAALVSSAINRTGLGRRAKTTGGNIGKSLSKAGSLKPVGFPQWYDGKHL